jgi:uncharacterized membrane protein YfcA
MTPALWAIFVALGAYVGFLAGLLGIGGGFTIVPVLAEVFAHQDIGTMHLMPLAIGTSAASIVFTAFASARAHHKRGAVAWPIVQAMAPGLVIGSLAGPQIASALPMRVMAAVVGSFTWLAALRMFVAGAPRATRPLPGKPAMFGVGVLIGVVAGMVGTGGAFLAVPFMTRSDIRMHTAVATSAAIGWPVALASALGFVFAGWHADGLPAYSLGYVYLPALAGIVVVSMLFAPLGARAAHAMPVARLRVAFALLLFVLGAWMWWKALRP